MDGSRRRKVEVLPDNVQEVPEVFLERWDMTSPFLFREVKKGSTREPLGCRSTV